MRADVRVLRPRLEFSAHICRARNHRQCVCLPETSKPSVLVCEYAHLGDDEYLDHRGKCVFKIDQGNLRVVSSRELRPGDVDLELEDMRAKLDAELMRHLKPTANSRVTACSGVYATRDAGEAVYNIVMSATLHVASGRNSFDVSGSLSTVWQARFKPHTVHLRGRSDGIVHATEDGAMERHETYAFDVALPRQGSPTELAISIITAIVGYDVDWTQSRKNPENPCELFGVPFRRWHPRRIGMPIMWDKIHTWKLAHLRRSLDERIDESWQKEKIP